MSAMNFQLLKLGSQANIVFACAEVDEVLVNTFYARIFALVINRLQLYSSVMAVRPSLKAPTW